tara:strand:- start:884 stop:1756 length:873 start_codon:yes stop_codon:yes gene_type:complete
MKKLLFFVFLFLLIGCVPEEPAKQPFEGRELVKFEELNQFGDLCRKEAYSPRKWGHHLILVDTTVNLNQERLDWIDKNVFNMQSFREIPPYDLVSIYNMTGSEQEAAQMNPLVKKCRPLTGDKRTNYTLDQGDLYHNLPDDLRTNWNSFIRSIDRAKKNLFSENPEYSLLFEVMKEISRLNTVDFNDDYKFRKLIIVSDMVQNSGNTSLQDRCNKKFPDWESYRNDKENKNLIDFLMPEFGDTSNISVEIFYLRINCDKQLNTGAIEFWNSYFAEAGISNVKWTPETLQE